MVKPARLRASGPGEAKERQLMSLPPAPDCASRRIAGRSNRRQSQPNRAPIGADHSQRAPASRLSPFFTRRLEHEHARALDLGVFERARGRDRIFGDAFEPVEGEIAAARIADRAPARRAARGLRARRSRPPPCRARRQRRRRARRPSRRRGRRGPRRSTSTATPFSPALSAIAAGANASISLASTRAAPAIAAAIATRPEPEAKSSTRRPATRLGMLADPARQRLSARPGEGPERRRQAGYACSSSSVLVHSSTASSAR